MMKYITTALLVLAVAVLAQGAEEPQIGIPAAPKAEGIPYDQGSR